MPERRRSNVKDKMKMTMNSAENGKGLHTDRMIQHMKMTRQIRVFSEMTSVEMISNENACDRFRSYMNMMNTLKRK